MICQGGGCSEYEVVLQKSANSGLGNSVALEGFS